MASLRLQNQAKLQIPSHVLAGRARRSRYAVALTSMVEVLLIVRQVEDLFYNVPTRRRAFRSASEEYAKILDLVGRYAIHCNGVAFSCKKQGESGSGLAVPSNAGPIDRIRLVHNSAVANDLLPFDAANDQWGFKSIGYVSSANYNSKKATLLLFINHRSVESSAIKKAVEHTYSPFLPKGGHPFVYLSLEIDPARVDVNVHPTKREVNFLNEEEIIEVICDEIRTRLGKVDTSRTFMTQSLLSSKRPAVAGSDTAENGTVPSTAGGQSEMSSSRRTPAQKPATPRTYENNLVRVDSRVRKITSMLPPGQRSSFATKSAEDQPAEEMEYEYSEKEPTICKLTTVRELRAEVRDDIHQELTNAFANHTFVGVVDERRRIAAIQGGVKLFLVDYGMVSSEYFYQLGLTDFGNFGAIRFDPSLSLKALLQIAATHEREMTDDAADLDWDKVVQMVYEQLISRRDMLAEYFALEISEDGDLLSIPLLMKGYQPSLAKLPNFLLRLGPHVDWGDEKGCFQSFLRELASFYVPESLPSPPAAVIGEEENQQVADRRRQLKRAIEVTLFPAFRARLVATRGLLKGVVEVADLKGLYRVFERC